MAAGGAAGFGISWAVYSVRGGMRETAENLSLAFQENAWIFQTAFFLMLTAVSLIFLRKAVASLQKGTDEELDRAGEYQNTAMMANIADMILQFLLFGLAADGSNSGLLLSVVLFLGFCIVILFLEASLVRQIQKADPMKRRHRQSALQPGLAGKLRRGGTARHLQGFLEKLSGDELPLSGDRGGRPAWKNHV